MNTAPERTIEPHAADRQDRVLLQQIAAHHDRTAMETLYNHYRPRLTGFLRRMTRDEGLIEEAYNDVMLKIWQKADQFQSNSKVSSWIFSIAYRTCLRMVKKQKFRAGVLEMFGQDAQTEPRTESESADQAELIGHALETLSAEHRMAVELSYFQGYSTEEISKIAGCPANTVKTRLYHARKRIRAYVEQESGLEARS